MMSIFLRAIDFDIWDIVVNGFTAPFIKDESGMEIPKPTSEWSDEEKKKSTLDARAMNSLNCALSKQEYFRVSDCQSAHEIWKRLEVVYEGTSQVKKSKISRLTREYELFQMETNESIHNMNTRFTNIINSLAALGKTFTMSERVKKVLRSLPKE